MNRFLAAFILTCSLAFSAKAQTTLVEIDFTTATQPPVDIKAGGDGSYNLLTTNGSALTWFAVNTVSSTTFSVTSTGLVITYGAATAGTSYFYIPIASSTLLLDYSRPMEFWARLTPSNFPGACAATTDWAFFAVSSTDTTFFAGAGRRCDPANPSTFFAQSATTVGLVTDCNQTNAANLNPDVILISLRPGMVGDYFTGSWNNGWPAKSTMMWRGFTKAQRSTRGVQDDRSWATNRIEFGNTSISTTKSVTTVVRMRVRQ